MTFPSARTFVFVVLAGLVSCTAAKEPAGPPTKAGALRCASASLALAPDTVVGEVNGKPITIKDLGDEVAKAEGRALREYCDAVHQARAGALDGYVTKELVEAAAAKEQKAPELWVQEQVEKRAGAPSEADIQAFYDARKRDGAPPLEVVRDQVVTILSRERQMSALEDLFAEMKKTGGVKEQLPDVRPPPADVSPAAHTPTKGPKTAKVKVVEFADFECPYCSRAAEQLSEVQKKYGDKIEVSYRHFPLTGMHQNAQRAAEVAQCAGEQGKFWAMHDALYASQEGLAEMIGAGLDGQADKLQLDKQRLNECLASGRATAQVEADLALGNEAGVQGTPSVFVNGRQVSGGASTEALSAAIDAEL
jgi:protein-disulfide isomerase